MVRPQDIHVARASNGDGLSVTGVVTFREFLGANVRYSVQAGTTPLLVDVPFHANDTLCASGDEISLFIPADATSLIET